MNYSGIQSRWDAISAIRDAPGLYISDITIPQSPELLREHGITHVVSLTNLRDCPKFEKELDISHLHVDVEDNPYEDLIMSLEGICAWIEHVLPPSHDDRKACSAESETRVEREPRVLVHCLQGMSRSGAIIVAYLMRTRSLDYESALALAQHSRSVIVPNSGFGDQLRLWRELDFSIYTTPEQDVGKDGPTVKPEYKEWKSNRGILLSREQQEKEQLAMRSMADIAVRLTRRTSQSN